MLLAKSTIGHGEQGKGKKRQLVGMKDRASEKKSESERTNERTNESFINYPNTGQ